MNYDYKNTLRRLEKITATLNQLIEDNRALHKRLSKRDEPLILKVRKLEQALSAMSVQAAARERVLASLTTSKEMPTLEEITQSVREKDIRTADQSKSEVSI